MEEILHHILSLVVEYAILFFEFSGVCILVLSGIKGVVNCIRKNPLTRLNLAKGMAMGLEFKLGSEILRTVVVRELSEIYIVGAIILLRAALTFLIHWEINEQEHRNKDCIKTHEQNKQGKKSWLKLIFGGKTTTDCTCDECTSTDSSEASNQSEKENAADDNNVA